MTSEPDFDLQQAHRWFSTSCFNGAWELIEKEDRTVEQDFQMFLRAAASAWHWSQRADCSERNLSIGYWQLSRVCALMGEGRMARRFGKLCQQASDGDEPFYVAYAYECLARSAAVMGYKDETQRCLTVANKLAEKVEDPTQREQLLKDLATVVVPE